jgi:microtubule-associated protein-like 1/2
MNADGTDVNTACRSNGKSLLVTGDDFGQVNLFKFPVVTKKQTHKEYIGHSSHVTRARFAFDDTFLITTGGIYYF